MASWILAILAMIVTIEHIVLLFYKSKKDINLDDIIRDFEVSLSCGVIV